MGTDGVRAGAGPMRRIGLLAVLLALLVPLATTATTTAPTRRDAAALVHRTVEGAGSTTDAGCDGHQRDGSDTVVRVVKKVRGVFLPHGLAAPTFAPADAPARHGVFPTVLPQPRSALPGHLYPRRGPPAIGVHPTP